MNLISRINKAYDDMMMMKKGDCCSTLSFPESAVLNGKLEKLIMYNTNLYMKLHQHLIHMNLTQALQ